MNRVYVRDLAGLIVAEADPAQVAVFEAQADEYFEDPGRSLRALRSAGSPGSPAAVGRAPSGSPAHESREPHEPGEPQEAHPAHSGNGLAAAVSGAVSEAVSDLVPLALAVAEHLLEVARFVGGDAVLAALDAGFGRTTRARRRFWRRRRKAEAVAEEPGNARPFDPLVMFAAYGDDPSRVHATALAGAAVKGARTERARQVALAAVAVFAPWVKSRPTSPDENAVVAEAHS